MVEMNYKVFLWSITVLNTVINLSYHKGTMVDAVYGTFPLVSLGSAATPNHPLCTCMMDSCCLDSASKYSHILWHANSKVYSLAARCAYCYTLLALEEDCQT